MIERVAAGGRGAVLALVLLALVLLAGAACNVSPLVVPAASCCSCHPATVTNAHDAAKVASQGRPPVRRVFRVTG